MASLYYPKREISLVESMMGWRGRLGFRQYIRGKRHKYGIKLYVLAESDGLVCKVLVYSGKSDEEATKSHTYGVVLHLMNGYLNSGHSLCMDNYYNSPELAVCLLRNNTYVTGTLRARAGLPLQFTQDKREKNWEFRAERGEQAVARTTLNG